MSRSFRTSLMLCAWSAILLGTLTLRADITGSISGIATDPSGAVVPGVTVTVISKETGIHSSTVTDGEGFYSLPTLAIGHYDLSVSHPGFDNFLERGIVINANSAVRVDVKLILGSVKNTVVVKSDTLRVETQSTQMGEVIGAEKIESVPLFQRSYIGLLSLQPGVVPQAYSGTDYTSGIGATTVSGDLGAGSISVNGGRENSNGYMINGADAEEGVHNRAAIIPNLDSIAEFRIITNNFDAEYGDFSGGQVNVVTKSGGNQVHGDAFEFLENNDLNAKDYFSQSKGVYRQNVFGGTFGGPIKRDKAFFFVDFQGTRQEVGTVANVLVPSPTDRTGNLQDLESSLENSDPANGGLGVQGPYWANLLSNELGYSVSPGEPYYSVGCTNSAQCVFPNGVIPASAINPVAANTLHYIEEPNVITSQGDFYQTTAYPGTLADYKGGVRVDGNTHFGSLFGYYYADHYTTVNPYGGSNFPGFADDNQGLSQLADIGLTTTINTRTINNFRFVYLRDVNLLNDPSGGLGVSFASLGFATPWGAAGGLASTNPSFAGVPQFQFNNFAFGVVNGPLRQYNNTVQGIDNFTRIIGTHTFQIGVDYHYDQINERNTFNQNGTFAFNGAETGSDFADYLLGAPMLFNQASTQVLDSRNHYFGVYGQDSWRATQNLTLNYGLRYEISPPWYDTQNKIQTVIPGEQSRVFPGAPLGLVFPGDPGVPRTLAPTRYNDFAPRFGIAYTPSASRGLLGKLVGGPGKTSIRAGAGIFYQNISDAGLFVEIGDAPFGNNWQSPAPPLLQTPYIDRGSGFNEGVKFPFVPPPPNTSPQNPDNAVNWPAYLPISGSEFYYPKNKVPYTEEFEASLQRQLGPATVVTLSYVGSLGRHNPTFWESNPGNIALCLELSNPANVAANSPTCGPGGENTVYTLANGQTVAGTRQTFGNNFGSNPYILMGAFSDYNSLQASLKHQDKYDNFLLGYTWSKSMDDGSTDYNGTNPYNPHLTYGLSSFDVTNNFVASYTVQAPFNLLFGNGPVSQRLAGGWAVSGITTFASGLAFSIGDGGDRSLSGTGDDYPDFSNNGSPLIIQRNPRKGGPFFNRAFFAAEPLGGFGRAGRYYGHGPGLDNYDLALLKNTKIVGGKQLQIRAEAFNAFNHTQFANPSGNYNNSGVGGFGYVTGDQGARTMQVALKVLF
jgi:Carboxypeptidase regulatory-like domain